MLVRTVREGFQPVLEEIASGQCEPSEVAPNVQLREFVSSRCGAQGLSTGLTTLAPHAELPYHRHDFSEATTVIDGIAEVEVQGRSYSLTALDSIHVPAGVAHRILNPSHLRPLIAHWALASSNLSQESVQQTFEVEKRGSEKPMPGNPEHVSRFADAVIYELADGARFRDLFAGRFGSVGICGGYGEFHPGASLPCHLHSFDESITIMKGKAVCQVAGRQYHLSGCDTAFVPEGRPHRFLNCSDGLMAMIWVYAGSEPERTLVEAAFCEGTLQAPPVKESA